MTNFLIDFDILESNSPDELDKKWTDQSILDWYAGTDLKVTSQERVSITFNRFNCLKNYVVVLFFPKDKNGKMQIKAIHFVGNSKW